MKIDILKSIFVCCLLSSVSPVMADAQEYAGESSQEKPLISVYDKYSGMLDIFNVGTTSNYRILVELQCESDILAIYEFDLDDLGPYGTAHRKVSIDSFPEWKDTYLNIHYYTGDELIASEQILVDKKPHHRIPGGGTVKIDASGDHYMFQGTLPRSGRCWDVRINNKTGFVDSYRIGNQEYLATPIHPEGWKPSDVSFVLLKNNGTVVVNSSKGMIIYAASGDGTVFMYLQDSFTTSFAGSLTDVFTKTEFLGRGPHNSNSTDAGYEHIGRFEQQPGWEHSNMRWFSIANQENDGLVFESDYEFMATTDSTSSGVSFSFSSLYGNTDFYLYPLESKLTK